MTTLKTALRGLLCTLAVLPSLPALAREPAPVPVAETTAAVRPALWKVADADTTIWLFGTIHILPGDVAWNAGPVADALGAAQELVTEIAIDETAASQAVIVAKGRREDGRTLRDTLSPQERAAYEAGLASIGLPPQAFDANDAWFAALMLTLIPLKTAGYNLESGVDTQIARIARERGMANHALETAEFQIGLFDSLPEPVQRRYLAQVLEAMPTMKADIGAMVIAWQTGRAEELAHLLNEEEDDPALRKVLLTGRNKTWAKWLRKRLEQPGTVFLAVGAGHLAGKGSVQDQLARRGIKAVRVQ